MPDCIFCKIVSGELPSNKVYEDDAVLAFFDIHPVNPGHTLVIPKEHAATIFDMSAHIWGSVQGAVHRVAIALEKGAEADGVNLMMNNREHAGQVVHHAHVHLIPRYKGDGLQLWPHHSFDTDESSVILKKTIAALGNGQ